MHLLRGTAFEAQAMIPESQGLPEECVPMTFIVEAIRLLRLHFVYAGSEFEGPGYNLGIPTSRGSRVNPRMCDTVSKCISRLN